MTDPFQKYSLLGTILVAVCAAIPLVIMSLVYGFVLDHADGFAWWLWFIALTPIWLTTLRIAWSPIALAVYLVYRRSPLKDPKTP